MYDDRHIKVFSYYQELSVNPKKRQTKIAADDILFYDFNLSKKRRLSFSCEYSA